MNKPLSRLATSKDAAMLAQLNRHVHQIHIDHVPTYFKMPSIAESTETYTNLLADPTVYTWMTFVGETAVAYILIRILERAEDKTHRHRRWLYIDQISVEPEWKGNGFGRNLVETALQHGRDQGITEVEVTFWAFNRESRAFFYKLGFRPQIERLHLTIGK